MFRFYAEGMMNFPDIPIWLAPLTLVIGVLLMAAYIALSLRAKTERCRHCGTENPIAASKCENCSESMLLPRMEWRSILGALGMMMGFAPLLLLLVSIERYSEPPIPELIVAGIGLMLFVGGTAVLAWMPRRKIKVKQKATIQHLTFYGGFCGKCGTELLGGWSKCPKCGWKVSSDKPNWATAAKNGKTSLPKVELKVICYKCKFENTPASTKCKQCATNLLTYEPVWQRVAYFVFSLLFSLGAGWLALRIFENPDLEEGFSALGFGLITLMLIAVILPFWGLYRALSHGSLTEMLKERAGRHDKTQPWQALEDLGHALELAPVQEHAQIMKARMSLYRSLSLMQNATREELAITYARERNPQGGMGLFIAGNMFGDSFSTGYLSGISKQARKDREKMYAEGRAIVVGYCPVCKQAVELNLELRCPKSEKPGVKRHTGKPKLIQYVIPADVEVGKAHILRAAEAARKQRNQRIVKFLVIFALVVFIFWYLANF